MKIVSVVVTYNRLDKLKQCIRALKQYAPQSDIIVINNASTDGTKEWLDANIGLIVCSSNINIGGAGGFNMGMRKAVELGYEYIWVMDDDCIVGPNTLIEFINAENLLKGNYGWLSSVVLWTDGTPCVMNKQKVEGNFYKDLSLLEHGLLRAKQATFVSLWFKSETIYKYGLPIKEFFIWGDDVEYTRRIALRAAEPSYIVGKSKVEHVMASNNGSNIATDVCSRLPRYKYAFRNEGYLYRKEGFRGIIYFVAKCIFNIYKVIIKAPDSRLKRLWIIVSSSMRGLLFSPKVEYLKK